MNDIKCMREDQTNLQLELESREYEFTEHLAQTQATGNNAVSGSNNATIAGRSIAGPEDGALSVAPDDSNTNVLLVDREALTINTIAAQLAEATHEQDINQIFRNYEKTGEDNFSLYKYIHSLSATKEALVDEIRDLKTLLSEENAEEAQQQRIVYELEGKLELTEYTLGDISTAVEKMKEAIHFVGATAEDVHQHVGCGSVTCTETNLLATLGNIEERATYILCATQRQQYQAQISTFKKVAPTGANASATTAEGEDIQGADLSQNSAPPDEHADYEVTPLLPLIAPQHTHAPVSAKRLVRQTDLPSAALGAADVHAYSPSGTAARGGGNTGASGRDESLAAQLDVDDTQVVSHADVRRQMEQHLLMKRDRDERMARKKKEIRDMIAASPKKGLVAATSPSKGNRY
ncbi:outer dynein arm docking complex protein [Strigomonas culicis]|nr:outer dynein arm docking complex protein [Strigomonas culicis]|eukprot:EPY26206.1 outer dynein arm docking complex protein [Strigomonas culicis]